MGGGSGKATYTSILTPGNIPEAYIEKKMNDDHNDEIDAAAEEAAQRKVKPAPTHKFAGAMAPTDPNDTTSLLG